MTHARAATKYASLEDAVCDYIDHLAQATQKFELFLERYALEGKSPLSEARAEQLNLLGRVLIAQLSAVIHVHHEVLDDAGKTSYLIKATETMDQVCLCLDHLDVLSWI